MKIKNCPFCDGPAEAANVKRPKRYHIIRCNHCGSRTGLFGSPEDAIKSWNNRTQITEFSVSGEFAVYETGWLSKPINAITTYKKCEDYDEKE